MNMVVAYDIADPRRLNRVAKVMKDFGVRVQKSIFEVEVSPAAFREMRQRTEAVMELAEDGVKYFPLCDRCADTLVAIGLCACNEEDGPYVVL